MSSADENANLQRWKREALEVLAGWERVWEALGRPGELGQSKYEAALAAVERVLALADEWEADSGRGWLPNCADELRAALAASNAGTDRADRERVAETLYRMNGRAWYGRDLGRWDDPGSRISGDEYEKDRWRRQADHLMGVRA